MAPSTGEPHTFNFPCFPLLPGDGAARNGRADILAWGLTSLWWLLSYLVPFPPPTALSWQHCSCCVASNRHGVTKLEVRLHPKAGTLYGALPVTMLVCVNLLFLPFFSWHCSKWSLVLKASLACAVYGCDYVCWKQPFLFYKGHSINVIYLVTVRQLSAWLPSHGEVTARPHPVLWSHSWLVEEWVCHLPGRKMWCFDGSLHNSQLSFIVKSTYCCVCAFQLLLDPTR